MNYFMANRWIMAGASAVATLLAGCAPTQVEPTASAGTLNLQRYVAVGDSYSSGFSDGGLTRNGQENSFPALLAQVFERAGGGPFVQPLLGEGTGTGYRRFIGGFDSLGLPKTVRVAGNAIRRNVANPGACGGADTILVLNRWANPTILPQNMGVAGLRLTQIQTPKYGNEQSAVPATIAGYNPYFERLLPANDSRTYLEATGKAARSATFFTFFAGLDDLLPYLRTGAVTGAGCDAFPNQTIFANNLISKAKLLLDSLQKGGQRGIVAQLPNLNTIPLLKLGATGPLQAQLRIKYHNPSLRIFVVNGRSGSSGTVERAEDDPNNYILASALSRIGKPMMVGGVLKRYGLDSLSAVRNEDVIDRSEYSVLQGIVTTYNTNLLALVRDIYKMPALSNASSGPLLDISASVFLQSEKGIVSIGGVQYSTAPVRGGVFSVDYYSLTPRGNGLLANAFIGAINYAYKASLPAVDVNKLPTTAQ